MSYDTTIADTEAATKVQMQGTKSIRKHTRVKQVESKTNSVKIQVKCVRDSEVPKLKENNYKIIYGVANSSCQSPLHWKPDTNDKTKEDSKTQWKGRGCSSRLRIIGSRAHPCHKTKKNGNNSTVI